MKPWDYERWELMGKSGTKIVAMLRDELKLGLEGGHVLSKREAENFRKILEPGRRKWPISVYLQETDRFFVMVARRLKSTKRQPPKIRMATFNSRIIGPARKLLDGLESELMMTEISDPRSSLRADHASALSGAVTKFLEECKIHKSGLAEGSRKGKRWDSDVKKWFVALVEMLCARYDSNFRPRRKVQFGKEENSRFRDACLLLGKKLFGDESLDWAIRQHVDVRNEARRQHRAT